MQNLQAIENLDLSKIKWKLMQPENLGGQGWSQQKCDHIEKEYKQFLSETESTEPTADVDKMWHVHILDTLKYHQDCMVMFGEYLHHIPSYVSSGFCSPQTSGRCARKLDIAA